MSLLNPVAKSIPNSSIYSVLSRRTCLKVGINDDLVEAAYDYLNITPIKTIRFVQIFTAIWPIYKFASVSQHKRTQKMNRKKNMI